MKNDDVSRIQGVCHVIHIFLGSSLGKVKLPIFIFLGYAWQVLMKRDLLGPFPSMTTPEKTQHE